MSVDQVQDGWNARGVVYLEVDNFPSVIGDGRCKVYFSCNCFWWDCVVGVVCADQCEEVGLCGGNWCAQGNEFECGVV